jgi:drug/metabolite transporter superfamily protein YnfA
MSKTSPTDSQPADLRRLMVLAVAVVLLTFWAVVVVFSESGSSSRLLAGATGRVGLVMAALWMAWPSLRKPARWLPPGIAVTGVLVLVVLAAQPRLMVVAIPALGTLLAVATIVRVVKRY